MTLTSEHFDHGLVLDDLMPRFQFSERHDRVVDATAEATWHALTTVTLADLSITRPLVFLRRSRPIAHDEPLLTHGPVGLLYRREREVAIAGAIARPWQPRPAKKPATDLRSFVGFSEPGWTKYLTEFRIQPGPAGHRCTLSTETRGFSTDHRSRRRFRLYWMFIRVPSGLIRQDILRSVARIATTQITD